MALSEHEQRLLEEMERNLLKEDAALAGKASQLGSTNRSAGKLVAGVLTMLIGNDPIRPIWGGGFCSDGDGTCHRQCQFPIASPPAAQPASIWQLL